MVLLGDAAHALTPDLGQGACQALEDAATLTALTADHDDLAAVLADYGRARRPGTQHLVRTSARAARFANTGHRLTARLRDTMARALPTSAYLAATADTFAWKPPPDPQRVQR